MLYIYGPFIQQGSSHKTHELCAHKVQLLVPDNSHDSLVMGTYLSPQWSRMCEATLTAQLSWEQI